MVQYLSVRITFGLVTQGSSRYGCAACCTLATQENQGNQEPGLLSSHPPCIDASQKTQRIFSHLRPPITITLVLISQLFTFDQAILHLVEIFLGYYFFFF